MRRLKRLWIFWLLAGIGMCSLGGTILAWVVRGGDLAATISAVSAALSALAILGVVVALYIKIQQTEIARVDALMTHRSELLMFAIGEPELLVSWGFDPSGNASVAKLQAYASMVFNHMWASFELNRLTPEELEYTCKRIFKNEVVTTWWGESRAIYHGYRSLPLGRRNFPELVDRVYYASAAQRRQATDRSPAQRTAPGP